MSQVSIIVSVRLPAPLVQRLDEVVDEGLASTRSEVVWRALEREFRHLAAVSDAAVLAAEADEPQSTGRHGDTADDFDATSVSVLPRRAWVD